MNDLGDLALSNGKIIAFADDNAFLFRGNTWNEVYQSAQMGFNKVYEW